MDAQLKTFLWRSSEVRSLVKKEAMRTLPYISVFPVAIVCFTFFTDRSLYEGLIGGVAGASVLFVMWFVAVVRTIRQVLREHSLL